MIYHFELEDREIKDFLALLKNHSLDYEIITRDKVVVRIFGQVDDVLREQLDAAAGLTGKLTLKKGAEDDEKNRNSQAPIIIAGPCSIESEEQLENTAAFLSERGIRYLRGGAFKPRTQSASFQGLGRIGLNLMAAVARHYNMKAVTELMDRSQLDDVAERADIIQVGSRNMFNYSLLTALGAVKKPILLKRGMAATIDEWLHAADYIRKGGNERIILCERGIRTFEPRTRYTLDLLAIPIARKLSGRPVIADVSHAAGDRSLVPPLIRAALAAGAHGIMVEVHPMPEKALSDAAQSLSFEEFDAVLEQIRALGFLGSIEALSQSEFPF